MNGKSLLVVDDEPAIRALVARHAEARGYRVREARCAGEALDRMAECPAAIALCDISMPDRDGLWLAVQLRKQFPDTAVIISSGEGRGAREASLQHGAMGHLPKPFTREMLVDLLEQAAVWHLERKSSSAWEESPLGGSGRGTADTV